MKMVKAINVIILFSLVLILSNCGEKKSVTSTKITFGNLVGLGAELVDGGIMVFGKNNDRGDFFAIKYIGQTLELNSGNWNFRAIAWDDTTMSGTTRCANLDGILVNGSEANVNLILNTSSCTDGFWGPKSSKDNVTAEPLALEISTCANKWGIYDLGFQACHRGVSHSYRVIIPEILPGGGLSIGSGAISNCFNHTTDPSNIATNIKLPFIATLGGTGVPTIIQAFDEASCLGAVENFVFSDGMLPGIGGRAVVRMDGATGTNKVNLYTQSCLRDTPVAGGSFRSTTTGEPNKTHIICNATQFSAIEAFITSNPTNAAEDIYVLGNNIDFGGSGFTNNIISQPFEASFYGENYTLSNATITVSSSGLNQIGIFKQIRKIGGPRIEISNLHINNINVVVNTAVDNLNSVGVLAGQISDSSAIARVKIENASINFQAGACPTTGCSKIGILSGEVLSSNSANSAEIYETKLINNSIATKNITSSVGGAIGFLGDFAGFRHSQVEGLSLYHTGHNISTQKFGGAVGEMNPATWNEIYDVSVQVSADDINSDFEIDRALGGLVGAVAGNARIIQGKTSGLFQTIGVTRIGGCIGEMANYQDAKNLVCDVDINDTDPASMEVGGAIGFMQFATAPAQTLAFVRAFGDLNCFASCGGAIGTLITTTGTLNLDNIHAYGDVSGINANAASDNIGGLAGDLNNSGGTIVVNNSHAEGDVIGYDNVGGLVGQRSSGTLLNRVYSLGDVTGENNVGGLIGNAMTWDDGQIQNCFSAGSVAGTTLTAGGIGNYTAGGTPPTGPGTMCYHLDHANDNTTFGVISTVADFSNQANLPNLNFTTDFYIDGQFPELKVYRPFKLLGTNTLGSESDPYILTNIDQWNAIGDKPHFMNLNYKLGNNLNFDLQTFVPWASSTNPFTGQLKGNDFAISNITLNDTGSGQPLGLFRVFGSSTCPNGCSRVSVEDFDESTFTSKKLYLSNINFTADSNQHVGALAGYMQDGNQSYMAVTINDVEVIGGDIAGNGTGYTGGLVGLYNFINSESKISGITSDINLSSCGTQGAGGIVGKVQYGGTPPVSPIEMKHLIYRGDINCVATDYVGGLIGFIDANYIRVSNSMSDSLINGDTWVGGLIGSLNSELIDSTTYSIVSGNNSVGGAVGIFSGGQISGVSSHTDVDASSGNAGAMIGTGNSGSVTNSFAFASVVVGTPGNYFIGTNTSVVGSLNYYVGNPDATSDGLATNVPATSLADSSLVPNLSTADPWIFGLAPYPILHWEAFPQYFEF